MPDHFFLCLLEVTGQCLKNGCCDKKLLQVSVLSSKVRILPKSQQVWILKFPEIPSRTAAEQMLGYRLIIPAAQREELKVGARSQGVLMLVHSVVQVMS